MDLISSGVLRRMEITLSSYSIVHVDLNFHNVRVEI